jgi:hypothetical protein
VTILVILLHLVVPHDHHSDSSFTEVDGTCTSHGDETETKSTFPHHCHAFNDLTFDKSRILVKHNNCFSTPDFLYFEIINPISAALTGVDYRYPAFLRFIKNVDSLCFSLLRAPPSLV